MESLNFLLDKFLQFAGNFSVAPNYVKAGAIILLLFLLIISLAQFRHHFVKWSLKGGLIGLFFGFLFTLIIEGFLLINGSTAVTAILGWNNAPKPIKTILDIGKANLLKTIICTP